MGGGTYSISNSTSRRDTLDYAHKSIDQIFTSKSIEKTMDPINFDIREARDSEEHPESIAVIINLDVTGSMGAIPHYLIRNGLPNLMGKVQQLGIKDPQILMTAIGDHECDRSPLQIGQFESSDELIDKWLTSIYVEGGGGGNNGESYLLAWYLATFKTSIDCWEKRKQKGFLFTIGDEPTLRNIPGLVLNDLCGNGQHKDYSATELLSLAKEKYHVFHLHLKEGFNGMDPNVMGDWKQLLGENLIIIDNKEDISKVIPEIIAKHYKSNVLEEVVSVSENEEEKEEIIL